MTNNFTDTNLGNQIVDRAFVLDTPSLVTLGSEVIAEEVIRDLLDWAWITATTRPKPHIVIPNDTPRSSQAASQRTQADTIAVTNEGETEEYHGHSLELVDSNTIVNLRITVPGRGGRQRMHNIKAHCREIVYRYAKVLSPYHRLYYNGFQPDYSVVNMHAGDMQIRLEAQRIPIISRRTTGQETPSLNPELFPKGLQV